MSHVIRQHTPLSRPPPKRLTTTDPKPLNTIICSHRSDNAPKVTSAHRNPFKVRHDSQTDRKLATREQLAEATYRRASLGSPKHAQTARKRVNVSEEGRVGAPHDLVVVVVVSVTALN